MKKFWLLSSLLLLLVFSACRTEPEVTEEETDIATDFKHTENVVYVRLPAEPDKLNPLTTTSNYSHQVYDQLFQPLLGFDPATYELMPVLVTSRPEIGEISEGELAGKVAYTYELREDARWDDGSPVTAEDVVFTYKVMFNPTLASAAGYRAYIAGLVHDIQTDPANPRTFTVLLNRKYILAEAFLGNLSVYPQHVYDPQGLLTDVPLADLLDAEKAEQLAQSQPALRQFSESFDSPTFNRDPQTISGSGPYRLVEWESGQRIVLERKQDWWAADLADENPRLQSGPERLVYNIIPDQTTALNAIRDQEVDAASQLDSRDFTTLRGDQSLRPYYNFETPLANQFFFISINTKDPLLEDKRVRRALAHLLDIETVINTLYDSLATPITGPIHPSKNYYHDELPLVQYDPARARTLLEQAGWKDSDGDGTVDKNINGENRELEIDYLVVPSSSFANNLALLMQENARQVGIGINIVPREFNAMREDWKTRNFQLYGGGFASQPLPDDLKQLWHTESDTPTGSNRTGFGNAESDALIDSIRVTLDEKKRAEMYRRFQEMVYEEQPMIFLFAPNERVVLSRRFRAEPTSLTPGYLVNEFMLRDLKPE